MTHDEQGALEQDILRLVGSRLLDPLEILLGDGASGGPWKSCARRRGTTPPPGRPTCSGPTGRAPSTPARG
ncbi:hypothetical protein ACFSTC_26280 [Nonomuraea ferruginea]